MTCCPETACPGEDSAVDAGMAAAEETEGNAPMRNPMDRIAISALIPGKGRIR